MMSRRFNKKGNDVQEAQKSSKPQVWRAKQIADKGQPSANIQMAFLLPSEFRAPAKIKKSI